MIQLVKNRKILVAAALLLLTATAGAATVSLQAQPSSLTVGGSLTVDLLLDASDVAVGCEIGGDPATRCDEYFGELQVTFDDSKLSFTNFIFNPPAQELVPVTENSGSVSLGFQSSTENTVLGSFQFAVVGSIGTGTFIGIDDVEPFLGSFGYKVPTDAFFMPEFVGVQVVPVPAAVWLFISALGVALRMGSRTR